MIISSKIYTIVVTGDFHSCLSDKSIQVSEIVYVFMLNQNLVKLSVRFQFLNGFLFAFKYLK